MGASPEVWTNIALLGQASTQAGFPQCMQESETVLFVTLGNCPAQISATLLNFIPSSNSFQDLHATSQAWHWTQRSLSK
jgi:hypothetical protein